MVGLSTYTTTYGMSGTADTPWSVAPSERRSVSSPFSSIKCSPVFFESLGDGLIALEDCLIARVERRRLSNRGVRLAVPVEIQSKTKGASIGTLYYHRYFMNRRLEFVSR